MGFDLGSDKDILVGSDDASDSSSNDGIVLNKGYNDGINDDIALGSYEVIILGLNESIKLGKFSTMVLRLAQIKVPMMSEAME
eukprot:3664215-Ditylum_brightwellii.AAC.1